MLMTAGNVQKCELHDAGAGIEYIPAPEVNIARKVLPPEFFPGKTLINMLFYKDYLYLIHFTGDIYAL